MRLQSSHQLLQIGVFRMYVALVCSFPVSGHILSERAMRKVISLFAIPAIFLHLLMTLVVYVNSGFVSLQIVFQVMIPEVQRL